MGSLKNNAAKAKRRAIEAKRKRWRIARTHEQIKAMDDEREYAMLSMDGSMHVRLNGKEWKRITGHAQDSSEP